MYMDSPFNVQVTSLPLISICVKINHHAVDKPRQENIRLSDRKQEYLNQFCSVEGFIDNV